MQFYGTFGKPKTWPIEKATGKVRLWSCPVDETDVHVVSLSQLFVFFWQSVFRRYSNMAYKEVVFQVLIELQPAKTDFGQK